MRTYRCTVCGFIYDEAKGLPDKGIAPGTIWEDVPEEFHCPICGARKTEFDLFDEAVSPGSEAIAPAVSPVSPASVPATASVSAAPEPAMKPTPIEDHDDFLRQLTADEIAAICTNLSKGCEKQRRLPESAAFAEIAEYFLAKAATQRGTSKPGSTLADAASMLQADLSDGYPEANRVATEQSDRGALRSLVWGEKVSTVMASLLDRFNAEGQAMLEGLNVYVCDICGFIHIGNQLPDICPICKVPNFKFTHIERS